MSELDRRIFLRGAGMATLGVGASSLLAACGTEGTQQTADECESTDKSDTEKTLFFSNWPEYIDVKGNKMPSLEKFQSESGIDVTYNADVNDNNEFFAKIQNQLGDCQPIGRDIMTLTDWMAARLVNLGWLQELDHDNIPNVDKNIVASLKSPDWDPNRDYSVPWQSGLTGIAYNAAYTGEVRSFDLAPSLVKRWDELYDVRLGGIIELVRGTDRRSVISGTISALLISGTLALFGAFFVAGRLDVAATATAAIAIQ